MTFATPILAGIAAAVAVPALIILYFLKLRRRDVEVSTTLLWKKAIQDLQANAPFQRLRNNILLFLQLLVLAAALLALAQPEYRDTGLTNARHIIVIDNSASMNATDGRVLPPGAPPESTPTTRLDAAKQRALQLVDALKEPGVFDNRGEEAMVIVFNTTAQVLQTFTSSKSDLRNAINGIQPTDAPGYLERAWALADAYTGKKVFQEDVGFVPVGPGATVHLLSDGRLPDAGKVQRGETDAVFFHRVGTPDAANVGITGIRAERAFDNPARLSIFVGLQSTARQPRSVDVELIIDGATTNVRDVVVGAAKPKDAAALEGEDPGEDSGDKWVPGLGGFVFPIDRAEGGIATVRISTREPDALPSDNIGYLVIPPAKRLAVALVSEGNLLVQSAFRGMKLSALDVIKPAQFQQMLDDGRTSQYDVFVLDRFLPQVRVGSVGAGEASAARVPGLPPGRSVVLGAVPPPPLGVVDEGPAEGAVFADFRRDHPALALSALDKVTISKFRRVSVRPDTPVRVLASTDKGPGVLEVSDASVLSIVIPWDPADSDWWLDPGWVLFMAGAVLYLSDSGAGTGGDMVRPGDTLRTRVPIGSRDVRLTTPDNARHNLEPAGDGSVAFGPVLRNGIYTVSWDGPGTAADFVVDGRARRPVAANLADPNESDIGAASRLDLANDRVSARGDEDAALRRKVWPYLLLAALAVIMLEWWVYNRKVAI